MPKKPEDIIRREIIELSAYHVPDSVGMVKLDAMENPYTLPADVRVEIARAVESAAINRYPDSGASRLKAVLREAMKVPQGMDLLLGNGSDEIIQLLVMAAAKPGAVVMGVEPSFVMFRMIATFCGVNFVGVPLTTDYELDADRMLAAIDKHQPAVIFIAYPNNPTGNLFDAASLTRIIEAAPGVVVVDEAYHAFAGKSFMPWLKDFPNLLVMRTVSKLGLAGLRLGLVVGGGAWLSHLDKLRLPYNVNVLTQLAAERVLQHGAMLDQQATAIKTERARLAGELSRLPGVHAYPSDANFILFKVAGVTAAADVFAGLKQRGVLIKNLHGSHPALEDSLRVTVGTPEENTRFLAALRESLAAT